MNKPVYLDYNATTPVDPAVVEAMMPYLFDHFGNASSAHAYGFKAQEAITTARQRLGAFIGARPDEVIFTGGGSETDNLAIKGVLFARLAQHPHVVSCVVEHPAVLNTLQYMHERFGIAYTLVPVDEHCLVSPDDVRAAIRPETVLVTIMHANNEVGTIQPVEEIARITRESGVLLHVDAAQSAGKVGLNVDDLGVDLLTIAGHKLYGPKGVGALYLRPGTKIDPLIHGSTQERGLRAGTENVAGIVGLGKACELASGDIAGEATRLSVLRDLLLQLLLGEIPRARVNGHPVHRLPNVLNVSLPGAISQAILAYAPDVAASTGSACHSGSSNPSPVLMAMGLPNERAVSALRLSLGRWTTREEVERAAATLSDAYRAVTELTGAAARA